MKIVAKYDQTITKAIRDVDGNLVGYEPTTHHYTFGEVGGDIAGGFYVKASGEKPPMRIEIEMEVA